MKIFISYRRKDAAREIGRIRDKLKKEFGDENVFRDLVDIPPGVDFRTILEKETNTCDVMLVIIGPAWASITDSNGNKRLFEPGDFTRIEVETGLKRLEAKTAIVIPVFVMDAMMPSSTDLPESLCQLTFQNGISIHDDPYFDFDMDRLITTIKGSEIFARVSPVTQPFEPKTIYIPRGTFLMGNPPGDNIPKYETPQHEVDLPEYYIGEYPVKNSEYKEFVDQTDKLVPRIMKWLGQSYPTHQANDPVMGVTWIDALKYCEWLSKETNRTYTLPNEAQWEKACRGAYGVAQPMGTILEWTCSLWGEKRGEPDPKYSYPWKNDGRNELKIKRPIRRVVRGYANTDITGLRRFGARYGRTVDDPGSDELGELRHGFRVILIK